MRELLLLDDVMQWRDSLVRGEDFVMIVPAEQNCLPSATREILHAAALTPRCRELCFTGVRAEAVHDYVDHVAEENHRFDLVTTWQDHESVDDFLWYFLFVSGRAPLMLIALADEGGA